MLTRNLVASSLQSIVDSISSFALFCIRCSLCMLCRLPRGMESRKLETVDEIWKCKSTVLGKCRISSPHNINISQKIGALWGARTVGAERPILHISGQWQPSLTSQCSDQNFGECRSGRIRVNRVSTNGMKNRHESLLVSRSHGASTTASVSGNKFALVTCFSVKP